MLSKINNKLSKLYTLVNYKQIIMRRCIKQNQTTNPPRFFRILEFKNFHSKHENRNLISEKESNDNFSFFKIELMYSFEKTLLPLNYQKYNRGCRKDGHE